MVLMYFLEWKRMSVAHAESRSRKLSGLVELQNRLSGFQHFLQLATPFAYLTPL